MPSVDKLTFCQEDKPTSILKGRKFSYFLSSNNGKHINLPFFCQKWNGVIYHALICLWTYKGGLAIYSQCKMLDMFRVADEDHYNKSLQNT